MDPNLALMTSLIWYHRSISTAKPVLRWSQDFQNDQSVRLEIRLVLPITDQPNSRAYKRSTYSDCGCRSATLDQ